MSSIKKKTQVVSPPKNDSDMACENNDMAREEILHQASPDVRTQRAYVEEHGKWSPERVARYVKRKAEKTIDDVAMTPFLRKMSSSANEKNVGEKLVEYLSLDCSLPLVPPQISGRLS